MRIVGSLLLMVAMLTPGLFAQAREIPVGDFFKDAEVSSVSLSPKGDYIAVSVPRSDRTVLAAFRIKDMELIGKWDYGENRHIDRIRWVNDERFFMYVSRKVGRFDFRVGTPDVYASNVDGSQRADIPNGGTYQIVDLLKDDPDNILVSRSIDTAFLSKMQVRDGDVRTVATAPITYGTFLVGHDGEVRYAFGQEKSNETVTLRRDGESWTQVHNAPRGEGKRIPLAMASDDKHAIVEVSEDGEPARLMLVDPETGKGSLLSGNPNVEADRLVFSSDGRELIAVAYGDGFPEYDFINAAHPEAKIYAGLINAFKEHAVSFRGISDDGRYVLVAAYSDLDPGSYYLYDSQTGSAKFLISARSWINPDEMSPMKPFSFTARDGTRVHGYVTLPRFSNGKNLPLILHPHGGPHGARDSWGFNPEVQFLANRGYAVLQVNFRGSGGYGNAFEKMGYRNWGTTMVDDMTDAVRWAIGQGIADEDRICTYGASYGGYAALQTVVREPDMYKCTIGFVGVYSLPLMFKDGDTPEDEWGRNYLNRIMPETLAEQQAQSPAYNVDRINIPVMLVQGEKDERVPMSQYRSLRDALAEAGKPAEITIVEEKEGHGFYDYDNQVELYAQMEAFLDKYLGSQEVAAAN